MTPRSTSGDSRLILGIDPGSSATGYGLILTQAGSLKAIEHGVVRPRPASAPLAFRLKSVFEALESLLVRLSPDIMAVETVFAHRNVRSALSLAECRGVALLAASRAGIEVREHSPREVKMAVAGYGAAGKEQVQVMVRALLGLPPGGMPPDASDALAIAICEANTLPLREALKRAYRASPDDSSGSAGESTRARSLATNPRRPRGVPAPVRR